MRLTLFALPVCAIPLVTQAAIERIQPKSSAPIGTVVLRYEPRALPATENSLFIPEGFEDLGSVGLHSAPVSDDLLPEAILIPVPAGTAGPLSWTVTVVPANPSAAERLAESISATPVQIGRESFLQVIVDPRVLDEKEREAVFILEAMLPPASLLKSPLPTSQPASPGELRIRYVDGDAPIFVSFASLGISAGDLAGLELRHHGSLLPIGGSDSTGFWFFAPRRHTFLDVDDSVFVRLGSSTPSPVMTTRTAFEVLPVNAADATVRRIQWLEENTIYRRTITNLPNFDRFFWELLVPSGSPIAPASLTITLPSNDLIASTGFSLGVEVHGENTTPSIDPDHFLDISALGVAFPRQSYNGRVLFNPTLTGSIDPLSLPLAPPHQVTIAVPVDTPVYTVAGSTDRQLLDRLMIEYDAFLRIPPSGSLLATLPGSGSGTRPASVAGFDATVTAADLLILDVSDPTAPQRILDAVAYTAVDGSRGFAFDLPDTHDVILSVSLLATLVAPDGIYTVNPLPTPAQGLSDVLRGVYVAAPIFHSELERLRAVRTASGEIIRFLDPQAAYDHYNGGQQSQEAIRSAIRDIVALSTATRPVPEILLVGHGSLDPRNYLGNQQGAQIHPFAEDSIPTSGSQIENPIDLPYTFLFGDDQIPDAAVGRLPARTVAQLAEMLDKILTHQANLPLYRTHDRPGVFLNDDDAEFNDRRNEWAPRFSQSGLSGTTINLATANPPTTTATQVATIARDATAATLQNTGHRGASLLMYTGHGSNNVWATGNLMTSNLVGTINTENQWPTVATFTCLNGYFAAPSDNPNNPALGERWLRAPNNRGAVVSIAPSSIDFYLPQALFALEFISQLGLPEAERPLTIGELMHASQVNYLNNFPILEKTTRIYIVFGDPGTPHGILPPIPASVGDWMQLAE